MSSVSAVSSPSATTRLWVDSLRERPVLTGAGIGSRGAEEAGSVNENVWTVGSDER